MNAWGGVGGGKSEEGADKCPCAPGENPEFLASQRLISLSLLTNIWELEVRIFWPLTKACICCSRFTKSRKKAKKKTNNQTNKNQCDSLEAQEERINSPKESEYSSLIYPGQTGFGQGP